MSIKPVVSFVVVAVSAGGDALPSTGRQPAVATKTKDDAYDQFMKEMENLF